MSSRAFVAVSALLLSLTWPAVSVADTIIAREQAPSKISAEQGRVAWSSYDPVSGDYHLTSVDATGQLAPLPVAPRKVPFDIDLGYLGAGVEVAAYSRCTQEPQITGGGTGGLLPDWATGKGCDIYRFDFATQREQRFAATAGGNASEFLPTVSPAERIAFARVYERRRGRRGRVPYLYAKRGSHSLRRLRAGPRGKTGLPGPTSLDLRGPRLAFSWDWMPLNRGINASTIAVNQVRGPHRTLESTLGGLVTRTLFSPSIVSQDVFWGRTVAGENGDRSDFRYDPQSSRGAILTSPAPVFLVATAGVPARGGIYYMTTQSMARAGPSRPPACTLIMSAGEFPASCTVVKSDPLTFTRERH